MTDPRSFTAVRDEKIEGAVRVVLREAAERRGAQQVGHQRRLQRAQLGERDEVYARAIQNVSRLDPADQVEDDVGIAARELGGGGSRDPRLAQAGGPNGANLDAALDVAREEAGRAIAG